MSGYTPYYSGGWQSGESGGTPITPAALNNMESGIGAALTAADIVDNLTSTATDKPLSANMGKVLNEDIAQSTANLAKFKTKRVTGTSGDSGAIATGVGVENYILGIRMMDTSTNLEFQGFVAFGGVWFLQTTANTPVDVEVIYREI